VPQNVPEFQFSENALRVRQFIYEFWCEKGSGPNLRDVHEATGLARQEILTTYRELDLGLILNIDQATQNANILKVQPFSAFPSQVKLFLDGRFHAYIGCAMESVACSKMPPFAAKEVVLESYCACCLEPVTVRAKDGEILGSTPDTTRIHVSMTPWEWNTVNIVAMCDSMNYVLDAAHAERYERQISRRGVLFDFDQATRFVAGTANNRMHDYHWAPAYMRPGQILEGIRALGVDVSNWDG
jgi:hypothetical protein